jgi:hypothetical protein
MGKWANWCRPGQGKAEGVGANDGILSKPDHPQGSIPFFSTNSFGSDIGTLKGVTVFGHPFRVGSSPV